ncbi:PH domain-containing protein [Salix suchowensis]|nr:PH domain-containing protein [Salix suchowensis]
MVSYLSSHHSDDFSLYGGSPVVEERELEPAMEEEWRIPSPQSSTTSSSSLSSSSPYSSSSTSLPTPHSIASTPPVPSLVSHSTSTSTTSTSSTSTVRARPAFPNLAPALDGIRDKLNALWDGQLSTNHILDELRAHRPGMPEPAGPDIEMHNRLHRIEGLVQSLLDRPIQQPPAPPFPQPRYIAINRDSQRMTALKPPALTAVLTILTVSSMPLMTYVQPPEPHIQMPIPQTAGPSLAQQLEEILSSTAPVPPSVVQGPPPLVPFSYQPIGTRPRSASPLSLRDMLRRPGTEPPLPHIRDIPPPSRTGRRVRAHPRRRYSLYSQARSEEPLYQSPSSWSCSLSTTARRGSDTRTSLSRKRHHRQRSSPGWYRPSPPSVVPPPPVLDQPAQQRATTQQRTYLPMPAGPLVAIALTVPPVNPTVLSTTNAMQMPIPQSGPAPPMPVPQTGMPQPMFTPYPPGFVPVGGVIPPVVPDHSPPYDNGRPVIPDMHAPIVINQPPVIPGGYHQPMGMPPPGMMSVHDEQPVRPYIPPEPSASGSPPYQVRPPGGYGPTIVRVPASEPSSSGGSSTHRSSSRRPSRHPSRRSERSERSRRPSERSRSRSSDRRGSRGRGRSRSGSRSRSRSPRSRRSRSSSSNGSRTPIIIPGQIPQVQVVPGPPVVSVQPGPQYVAGPATTPRPGSPRHPDAPQHPTPSPQPMVINIPGQQPTMVPGMMPGRNARCAAPYIVDVRPSRSLRAVRVRAARARVHLGVDHVQGAAREPSVIVQFQESFRRSRRSPRRSRSVPILRPQSTCILNPSVICSYRTWYDAVRYARRTNDARDARDDAYRAWWSCRYPGSQYPPGQYPPGQFPPGGQPTMMVPQQPTVVAIPGSRSRSSSRSPRSRSRSRSRSPRRDQPAIVVQTQPPTTAPMQPAPTPLIVTQSPSHRSRSRSRSRSPRSYPPTYAPDPSRYTPSRPQTAMGPSERPYTDRPRRHGSRSYSPHGGSPSRRRRSRSDSPHRRRDSRGRYDDRERYGRGYRDDRDRPSRDYPYRDDRDRLDRDYPYRERMTEIVHIRQDVVPQVIVPQVVIIIPDPDHTLPTTVVQKDADLDLDHALDHVLALILPPEDVVLAGAHRHFASKPLAMARLRLHTPLDRLSNQLCPQAQMCMHPGTLNKPMSLHLPQNIQTSRLRLISSPSPPAHTATSRSRAHSRRHAASSSPSQSHLTGLYAQCPFTLCHTVPTEDYPASPSRSAAYPPSHAPSRVPTQRIPTQRLPSESTVAPVPHPLRPVTPFPGDLEAAEMARERLERLDDMEQQLQHIAGDAHEAEELREREFRDHEEDRQRIFLDNEARRDHEVRERHDEIWSDLENRIAMLAPPPQGRQPPRQPPRPAVDSTIYSSSIMEQDHMIPGEPMADTASVMESLRASQEAASLHAQSIMQTIQSEREEFARERDAAAAERERLMADLQADREHMLEERDARIQALEDELAAVKEKQQRVTEEAENRERERQQNIERDEMIRNQLGDITNLLQDQQAGLAQKRDLMDERWQDKLDRRQDKDYKWIELRDMVNKIHDDLEADRREENERRFAAEQKPGRHLRFCRASAIINHILGIDQVMAELQRQNGELRELLHNMSNGKLEIDSIRRILTSPKISVRSVDNNMRRR